MEKGLGYDKNLFTTLPASLDTTVEINQILDFTLQSIEKNYGFEGVGIQIIDHEKKKARFYKLYMPHLSEEIIHQIEAIEIPLNASGGICNFVVQRNLPVYFEDIRKITLDPRFISESDMKSLKLLNHRTHLIIPVTFEGKVTTLLTLSSFSKTIKLSQEEIDVIKTLCINIGRVVYKTIYFQHMYHQNQNLMLDIIKAREARDNLLAGISHELKTPLNAVMGFSEYLSKIKSIEMNKLHEIADIIHKNGRHLLSIIQEVIEVYKINSGKINIDINEVSLADLVETISNSLNPLFESKKHRFECQVADLVIKSDYTRLSQILYNLLSNAIKYTPDKGIITLKAFEENNWVIFQISDNGIGMDQEDIENLFRPFQRGKAAYSKEEGSGLGLFITNELVKILDGEISVDSKPQKGSTFTLRFPRPLDKKA